MPLVVLKFGGSSLHNHAALLVAAQRAVGFKNDGADVVVVVSAMGSTTDDLLKLAYDLDSDPPIRELDALLATGEQVSMALLATAIYSLGYRATSLNGHQIRLMTTNTHQRAQILSVAEDSVQTALKDSSIVIVAGFQGITSSGETTTLGRGGSDTTALVLAAALNADSCHIFTDVTGIFTADPRFVLSARKLQAITYSEMLELSIHGANVMHPRAVLCGLRYHVPIHVRHFAMPNPGTIITTEETVNAMDITHHAVVGCAIRSNLGRVVISDLPCDGGYQAGIFALLDRNHISVDDILQTTTPPGSITITFTIDQSGLPAITDILKPHINSLPGKPILNVMQGFAKISIVGLGMQSQTGIAATMFEALKGSQIDILNVTTSDIRISCIVKQSDGPAALVLIHDAFGLESTENSAKRYTSEDQKLESTTAKPAT